MNEILGRNLRRLNAVAAAMGLHDHTLKRWVNKGLLDANGERVKLPVTRIGAAFWVDPADVRAMVERLNRQPEESLAVA